MLDQKNHFNVPGVRFDLDFFKSFFLCTCYRASFCLQHLHHSAFKHLPSPLSCSMLLSQVQVPVFGMFLTCLCGKGGFTYKSQNLVFCNQTTVDKFSTVLIVILKDGKQPKHIRSVFAISLQSQVWTGVSVSPWRARSITLFQITSVNPVESLM